MSKILILGDAGVPTGFGQVTMNLGDRLVARGHDVSVLAVNWRGDYVDSPMKFYLPTQLVPSDLYGQSRFIELLGTLVPDALIIINDPAVVLSFMFSNQWDTDKVLWNGFPTSRGVYRPPILHYCPIDGVDSPRSWSILDQRVRRIAMTTFGRDTAIPDAQVAWHGVDRSIYRPQNRTKAKRLLGYDPDRFLVVRADKNSLRKDYPATWQALAPVMRKHADIDVHFHCLPRASDGYDLRAVMFNDEDIRERVNFSAGLTGYTGWPEEMVATLLAAADLVVSTSWGEGWGLLNGQALACGTPVVATDCSANTEVIGPAGILVSPRGYITTPMGQKQALPDIEGFSEAIETLYGDRKTRRQMGEAGVAHSRLFDWDATTDVFEAELAKALEVSNAVPVGVGPAEGDLVQVRT